MLRVSTSGVSFQKPYFNYLVDVGSALFCIFKLKKIKSNKQKKKEVLKTPKASLYAPLLNVDWLLI